MGQAGARRIIEALSARGRIVVTATDTTAQQYETVFPEFFIHAFTDDAADTDKNGRVSVWEAFSYASGHVREWYQQRGRLQTERPLLDDNGDGVGREAQSPGPDGPLAQATYLDEGAPKDSGAEPVKSALLERRSALQNEIDQLKARRADMPPPSTTRNGASARRPRPRGRAAALTLSVSVLDALFHPQYSASNFRFLNTNTPTMPKRKPATCAMNATPPPSCSP